MGMTSGKKARMQRRLKELRKESELVRDDIRTLSRMIRNRDQLDALPKLRSGKCEVRPIPPPSRQDPVRGRMPAPVAEVPPPEPEEVSPREQAPRVPPRQRPVSEARPAQEVDAGPKRALTGNERFASYFSSGSFLGGPPLRQEKNVQRNKAVFMLVVVAIVFFIVFQLVFQ